MGRVRDYPLRGLKVVTLLNLVRGHTGNDLYEFEFYAEIQF